MQPVRNLLQQHLWDRIGWKATQPKLTTKAHGSAGEGGGVIATDVEALKAQLGSVVALHSNEEWDAAMQLP